MLQVMTADICVCPQSSCEEFEVNIFLKALRTQISVTHQSVLKWLVLDICKTDLFSWSPRLSEESLVSKTKLSFLGSLGKVEKFLGHFSFK